MNRIDGRPFLPEPEQTLGQVGPIPQQMPDDTGCQCSFEKFVFIVEVEQKMLLSSWRGIVSKDALIQDPDSSRYTVLA